uniref:Hexosyltransferase n=1 Tax=Bursaphelenchus xylophilus TaxID=6326 RepID=A0A1I7SKE5_BURXY
MESGLLKLKDHQVEYQMTRPSKENVCDGVDAVVYIMTMLTTDDTERRKVMRKLLFDKANLPSNHNVIHRYVVGRYPANRTYQQNLIDEMKAHDDIIFVNYEEVYGKNYIKWHAMHEWHMKHCPQAKTFIKIDDDTAIYLKRTFQWLDRDFGGIIKNTTEYFVCNALSTDSAPSRALHS